MMAELGLAALWMAAAMALLQLAGGFSAFTPKAQAISTIVRPVAIAQGVLCAVSFAALVYVFWVTDLSVKLVANNSHIDKPMIFKLAGAWGNHEGSMLMWVSILSVAGAGIALLEKRLDAATLSATLMTQAFLSLGFFAFLLMSSNPFERLNPAPPVGAGLNPLLQDMGLAFHPPTLYFGYVGLSVAFSFAVGALLTGKVGPAFARAMRPWALGAWVFLTLGITAGSYWAYYELGWGGWWFWDPVENASLMPWLAATALLHSVSVLANRDALRAWTVMLALVAFAMSMAGTFLVRSGILTSVHAFAVDPERGAFILGLLLLYVGGAFLLFALRIGSVAQGKTFRLLSREGAIVGNNILLSVLLGVVLIGTLYPLLAEAMGDKISVGPPYFNKAAVPISLGLMVLLVAGPMLKWRGTQKFKITPQLVIPFIFILGVGAVLAVWHPQAGVLSITALALAAGLAIASVMPLAGRNLRHTPIPVFGMVIAHFGLAVTVAGMASEAGFSSENLSVMRAGEVRKVSGWTVRLDEVTPVAGENWVALEGVLTASRGREAFIMRPQARNFFVPVQNTSEAALLTRWDGQLYAVIAPVEQGSGNTWQVRLWWKPFVSLIWAGGIMIALGGLIAMAGRMLRHVRMLARRRFWAVKAGAQDQSYA
jgi:cytochrome c-type biogenesis protein CcmF